MSSIDLLLVTPPSRMEVYQGLSNSLAAIEQPVWSTLIANYARSKGFSVEILDSEADGLTHEGTAQKAASLNAVLTVFVIYGQQPSASTQCMPAGRKSCEIFQTLSAQPTIVMGTHASALPKRTLLEEPYDYVVWGEGPETITGLLSQLKKSDRSLADVPGLCYKDDASTVHLNAMAPKIKDLDLELPLQAWDLLDMSKYKAHNWHCFDDLDSRGSYASLQTSLGCPYKCSFCCINAPFGGNGIRYWSPECILNQIDILHNEYGVKNIKIPDEMFVLNKKHVLGICDGLIERDYGLNIWAYARIDTLHPIFLSKLKKAGFNWLGLGIESGSDHVRDGVVKGRFGNEDIAETVNRVRAEGIYVGANYIFGLPDDTFKSMQQTLDLAIELNTEWANFYCAMAYPGSTLYDVALDTGQMLPDSEGGPGWIGYAQHAYECLPLPTKTLSAEEVLTFRDNAFDAYFQNPAYLEMIEKKFGEDVRLHINDMCAHSLKRKHHDEPGWIDRLQQKMSVHHAAD